MRTEQLEYLLDVAKTNSINKSSEKLHITHQSLNTAIKNLEKELGLQLFNRTFQGVYLTDTGKEAVKIAEDILGKYQALRDLSARQTAEPHQTLKGDLCVFAAPFMGLSLTTAVTKAFIYKYPQVNLKMKSRETCDIINLLAEKSADFYLLVTFFPEEFEKQFDPQTYFYQPLLQDRLYLATASTHPLAGYKSISFSTLLQYPLALFQANDDSPNPMFDIMPKRIKPKINLYTDHLETFSEVIMSGKSIGLIPQFSITTNPAFKGNEQMAFIPIKNVPLITLIALAHWDTYHKKQTIVDEFIATINAFL